MIYVNVDTTDTSNCGNDLFAPPPPKRRKQLFRDKWLEEEDFKPWLEKCSELQKAKCKACKKTIFAGKIALLRHQSSAIHTMNMLQMNTEQMPSTSKKQEAMAIVKNVRKAEIRICLDIVEHNRSFYSFRHFTDLCRTAWPDSYIARNMTLKRTKIVAIIRNVINKSIVSAKINALQNTYFSILIDESTDIPGVKTVSILARYFKGDKVQTYLLDLLRIRDSTAENLYKCLMHVLNEHQLLKNVVAFVDNANVMAGKENPLASQILKNNDEIAVFPCISHSMHLVAHHASCSLPDDIEELLHSICTYVSRNPKRQALLENTQTFMKNEQNKMIQPSMTRWISLSECVKRVMNQWDVLYSVFTETSMEENSKTVDLICNIFKWPLTKVYLEFLKFILPTFTEFNVCFESNRILIHRLFPECFLFLKRFGSKFLKDSCITDQLHNLDIDNEENLLPLESIIVGPEAAKLITEIKNNNSETYNKIIIEFYINVQNFYKVAFTESIKRLPLNEIFLESLQFLDPEIALYSPKQSIVSLEPLLQKFKSKVNRDDILSEWQALPDYFSSTEKEELILLDTGRFWNKISTEQNLKGELIFKNLANLASLCLSLPYSNDDVERYFSMINLIKTQGRNRLKTDTVSALTRIQLELRNENKNCYNYEIKDSMLELFNSDMYQNRVIPGQLTGILLPDESDASSDSDNEH